MAPARTPTTDAPPRGRPRSAGAEQAILGATLDLVADVGYARLSIQAVADRAGVTRPTVYRRWRSKADLAIGALVHRFGLDPAPDLGSLRDDLLEVQRHQIAFFNDPGVAGMFPGLLADLGLDPALAERWWEEFVAPRRASVHRALDRAVERGELAPGFDPEWVCDCLIGPLMASAFLHGARHLAPELAERSTDQVLAGLRDASAGR